MLLSADELTELTGYKQPTKQIWWLLKNGIRYTVGADGHPRVLASTIESAMGSGTRRTEPDAEALHDFLAERS